MAATLTDRLNGLGRFSRDAVRWPFLCSVLSLLNLSCVTDTSPRAPFPDYLRFFPLRTLGEHGDTVLDLAFHPAGATIGSASDDGTLRFWRLSEAAQPDRSDFGFPIHSLSFSFDGEFLATGGDDGVVHLLTFPSLHEEFELSGFRSIIKSVRFGSKSIDLYVGSWDQSISVLSMRNRQERFRIRPRPHGIHRVIPSPDGRLLAVGYADGVVLLLGVEDPTSPVPLGTSGPPILGLAWTPTGRWIVSGNLDGEIRVWDVRSRQMVRSFRHAPWVTSLAVSPCGRYLITAGGSGDVRFWKLPDGEELRTVKAHEAQIFAIAFSPDGRLMATAGEDKKIVLWGIRK